MVKTIKIIFLFSALTLIFLSLIVLALKFSGWSFSLHSKDELESSYSQFHQIIQKDEYVVVEETNNVTFNKSEFSKFLDHFPYGDTEVTLSLEANYKYYIKLSELTHELNDRTLTINIPALYLSTPVAFHSASLREEGKKFLFGKDPNELLAELRKGASSELEYKGKVQMNNVRDKATRSIAENLNNYFSNNGTSGYYDDILVVFEDDKRGSYPKYVFNNSFCDLGPCKFEFEFIEGETM